MTERVKKPFDNDVLRSKTSWTDEELEEERKMLHEAIEALEKMGDRFDLVVADLRTHFTVRDMMWVARGGRRLTRG